jgi:hypothetical protein
LAQIPREALLRVLRQEGSARSCVVARRRGARDFAVCAAFGLVAVVLTGALQRLGVQPGSFFWLFAPILAGIPFYPVGDLFARFECSGCSGRYSIGEVRSDGWIFPSGGNVHSDR